MVDHIVNGRREDPPTPVPLTSPPSHLPLADGGPVRVANAAGESSPGRLRRWLAVAGRFAGESAAEAGHAMRWFVDRWQTSVQLRVAATTAVASGIVLLITDLILVGTITAGLLDAKRKAAQAEAKNGLRIAQVSLSVATVDDPRGLQRARNSLLSDLTDRGTNAGLFSIYIRPLGDGGPQTPLGSGKIDGATSIPRALRQVVDQGKIADIYAPLRYVDGTTSKGLIIGAPLTEPSGNFQLYYLFPLGDEERRIALVRRTVLITGSFLVLLVAGIAVLVTRQVVRPVRTAALTAERLASGRLEERMHVHGRDELALLASAFNDMADSLQRQIVKLEDMSRLQRRFTSDVSHELRTPLTTVRMAADILHGARADFPPAVARSAELLHAELDRFETLLADLLEISRYDAHVAVLEPDPIDLRIQVTAAVEATASIAERQGTPMLLDLPAEAVVAEVDARRVQRILRNLLVNAAEHGAGQPIEICLRGDTNAAAITVRDHGVGLRPGEAALVFDRFWRADPSRNRRTGGTGLGLSIGLEDARLHGGWLHAWGRPGQGAQFRLTLPVRSGDLLVSSPLPIEPPEALRRRRDRLALPQTEVGPG